jgi:hypothetical protein
MGSSFGYRSCDRCLQVDCVFFEVWSSGEARSLCECCGCSSRVYFDGGVLVESSDSSALGVVGVGWSDGVMELNPYHNDEYLESIGDSVSQSESVGIVAFYTFEDGESWFVRDLVSGRTCLFEDFDRGVLFD